MNNGYQALSSFFKRLFSFICRYHWGFLLSQAILLSLILYSRGMLKYNFFNDAPSYILFNFSSLREILGGHRTMGLPLALKLYDLFFNNYNFWPGFQMLFYLASVFFLYRALLKFGFNKVLSLVVATHLIWESGIYRSFAYIMTEPLAASFLNLVLGALLYTFCSRNWKTYTMLGFFTFVLYQIRPNFSVTALLIPFWAVAVFFISKGFYFVQIRRIFLRYTAITIVPLFLFCFLRFSVVGQFGIVAFAGMAMAGHATYYLNEDNIQRLSGENRILAEDILARKRRLDSPWNLTPFDQKQFSNQSVYSMQNGVNPQNAMVAWLAAIKYKTGKEPFNDPQKNIQPWRHVQTLSGFFTIYNVEVDKLLAGYAKDILVQVSGEYLSWVAHGVYQGLKEYIKEFLFSQSARDRLWLCFLALMLFIVRPLVYFSRGRNRPKNEQWYRYLKLFSVLGFSFFFAELVATAMFSSVHTRYLSLFAIYLFPALTLWALPPSLANKEC